MMYNEELFNTSAKLISKTRDCNDDNMFNLQNELIKILIERFSEALKEKLELGGTLKIMFVSKFYGKTDQGYNEIRRLIEVGCFDSFASQYCLYLVGKKQGDYYQGDCYAYFEILWDYANYFEGVRLQKLNENVNLEDFYKLPIEYQRTILNAFKNNVEEYKKIHSQEKAAETCLQEGHKFSEWRHNKWSTFGETVIDHQFIPSYEFEHENWSRVCSRCGFCEEVLQEPKELVQERNERKKRARIKKLEAELRKLKDEN